MTGTPSRVASLRAECLERDRHRCVISHVFDYAEAKKRYQLQGRNEAKDDDGNLLKYERNTFAPLEVAHILPHSLMSVTNAKSPLVRNLSCGKLVSLVSPLLVAILTSFWDLHFQRFFS
jgi:hypothetical protein